MLAIYKQRIAEAGDATRDLMPAVAGRGVEDGGGWPCSECDGHSLKIMMKRLAVEEGQLAGSSSGAIVQAALEVARKLGPGKRVATVIPDSAGRYLSKNIFDVGR
jgi:uncharacterized protein YcfJ